MEHLHYCDMGYSHDCGAYDEYGDSACCVDCGYEEIMYDPINCEYYCPNCERKFTRAEHFNNIGANPPGELCLNSCKENYPVCKQWCEHYEIDENDPLM